MKDWLFKPVINPFEIFLLVIIAEWLMESWGVWTMLFIFPLFMLTNTLQDKIWKVEKHDLQSS